MTSLHLVVGLTTTALFACATVLGALGWTRRRPARAFWAILRREVGVMTVAAAVITALLLRAASVAGGL